MLKIMIMHKIIDNYGGRTCQLDWKYINSNLQPTGQLGFDTKGRVSYRQCRSIQKRGPTEAICLHENDCWMSLSWILSILPKLLASVHGYGWLYRLLSWLYFSLGQILYLRLPYQGWTLSWWSWVLCKDQLVTHLLVLLGLLNPNGMKKGFFYCCCLLDQQLTLMWLCNKWY